MQITVTNIHYKGHFFEKVTVDVPQINNLEDNNADWMIKYFVHKELNRLLRN